MKKSLLSSAAALIALSGMAAPQIQKAGTLDARANGNQFARQENLSIGSLMQNQASGMLKAPARINVPEGTPLWRLLPEPCSLTQETHGAFI